MNPGRRRLLIPGLLILLLIIVAAVGFARRAEAQTKPVPETPSKRVSVMTDPRVSESSGLAVSRVHRGIAYTFNDSGHAPQLFAIDIATGKTVGVTTMDGATWKDAEAMALFGGMVWVADVGTNLEPRSDQAVYAFPEPGRGNHRVTPIRYPVTFASKSVVEVEAMAIVPGRIDFYTKGWPAGRAYTVAGPLKTDAPNIAYPTARATPAWTTDASATPDGRLILVRGIVVVEVRDAKTWQLRYSDVIPILRQGESIAVEPSGRSYLIGSEGKDSPLVRIALDPNRVDKKAKPVDSAVQFKAQHPLRSLFWEHQWAFVRAGAFGLIGLIAALVAWRRIRRRRKEAADGN